MVVSWDDDIPNILGKNRKKCFKPPSSIRFFVSPVSLEPMNFQLLARIPTGEVQNTLSGAKWRKATDSFVACSMWVCLKIGYIPIVNSHLIGIMIINHWV